MTMLRTARTDRHAASVGAIPAPGRARSAWTAPYESVVRPLLFRLDAERAHNLTLRACEVGGRIAPALLLSRRLLEVRDDRLRVHAAGLEFSNPLGLAAGFDKNGHAVPMLVSMGFGLIEIGSISAYPSSGNPRPRLFRIPADSGIVVNYGVPNEGAAAVAERLRGHRWRVPLGINLVKTNAPEIPSCEPDVYEDFARSMRLLDGMADYIALNLSCPNSASDRDFFDDLPRLHTLLTTLSEPCPSSPVFLKLRPTTDAGRLREIVAIADEFPFVAGFGINLPSGKPPALHLTTTPSVLARMPGAVSGRPVEQLINGILADLRRIVGPRSRYTLMAAGGVFDAEGAYRKIRLGASLMQVYTGLIYRGPGVVREILGGLLELLERDGHDNVAEAVGTDVDLL